MLTIEIVQREVERYFRLSPGDISKDTNNGDIVKPRQYAMYFCRQFKLANDEIIGEKLANRDRATVWHSIRKIRNNVSLYKMEAAIHDELQKRLTVVDSRPELITFGVDVDWRPIPGFEGLYEVSKSGQVRSVRIAYTDDYTSRRIEERFLKVSKSGHVCLFKNGTSKTLWVAKIVANYWVPNPNNYSFVTHINKDKQNNDYSNVIWIKNQNGKL